MLRKIKIPVLVVAIIFAALLSYGLSAARVSADTAVCLSGYDHPLGADGKTPTSDCAAIKTAKGCPSGKVDPTDHTKCVEVGNECNGLSQDECLASDPIVHDLNLVVNFLSALVGVVVLAVIVLGGIQYSMAGDNPSAVTAAKQRIINGLIALVAFLLMFSFLQWLIPGGVFG